MIQNYKGIIYVFLSAFCFSFAGVLLKSVTWPSIATNGGRCFFSFFTILVFMKLTGCRFKFNGRVLNGAIVIAAMNITFTMANKMTTAANAIVLQFTMPLFIILLNVLLYKKKPTRIEILCSIGVFGGILFFFIEKLSTQGMIGNFVAILSGALYAVVFLMKRFPGANYESSILISCVISFIVGIPWYGSVEWTPENIAFLAASGILQNGLGFVFLSLGLAQVSAIAAALISTIEPVLNPIWTMLAFGEMIGPMAFIGAAMVLISSLAYNILSSRKSSGLKTYPSQPSYPERN